MSCGLGNPPQPHLSSTLRGAAVVSSGAPGSKLAMGKAQQPCSHAGVLRDQARVGGGGPSCSRAPGPRCPQHPQALLPQQDATRVTVRDTGMNDPFIADMDGLSSKF